MEYIRNISDFTTYLIIAIFVIMGVWKCSEVMINNAYEQATEQARYMLIFNNAEELSRATKALYPTAANDTITNHNSQNQAR